MQLTARRQPFSRPCRFCVPVSPRAAFPAARPHTGLPGTGHPQTAALWRGGPLPLPLCEMPPPPPQLPPKPPSLASPPLRSGALLLGGTSSWGGLKRPFTPQPLWPFCISQRALRRGALYRARPLRNRGRADHGHLACSSGAPCAACASPARAGWVAYGRGRVTS